MSMCASLPSSLPRLPRKHTSQLRVIRLPSLDAAPPAALTPELVFTQEQSSLLSLRNCLGSRLHAKLSIDTRQVRLNSLDRDAQALPDLAIARSPHDQPQPRQFTRGQWLYLDNASFARSGQQQLPYLRAKTALPGSNFIHCLPNLAAARTFEPVPFYSQLEHGLNIRRLIISG